jgi:hypothetical protein
MKISISFNIKGCSSMGDFKLKKAFSLISNLLSLGRKDQVGKICPQRMAQDFFIAILPLFTSIEFTFLVEKLKFFITPTNYTSLI